MTRFVFQTYFLTILLEQNWGKQDMYSTEINVGIVWHKMKPVYLLYTVSLRNLPHHQHP